MSESTCKYCGDSVKWVQEIVGRSRQWVPTDPITGQDHRSLCLGKDTRIALRGSLGKAIKPTTEALLKRIVDLEKRLDALEGMRRDFNAQKNR